VSASAARSRSASAASVLPPLAEELACADVPQWLRFCDQARRRRSLSLGAGRAPVGLEDGQRYGVLNRTVVEVQSICLPPSATSLLDPTIFPLLRLLSLSLSISVCVRAACWRVCSPVCVRVWRDRSVKEHPNIWSYSVLRLEELITGYDPVAVWPCSLQHDAVCLDDLIDHVCVCACVTMACSEISLQIVREHLPAAVDLETVIAQVRRGVDDEGRDIAETQIPLHTRLYIAWHVALGLRELHMRGIAHGDLSQANVLVRTHTHSLS
jgi:hypothetical protein